jgi:Homeodomain-like domain
MQGEERMARQRLSVLQLAEALDNVSAACRQRGMTRTQFYDYTRRFELRGLEGLKDLPPIHKSHPQTTPPEVVEQILALSLVHPAWGCVRLSERLKLDGVSVSSPTIQNLLLKHDIGTKFDGLLKLEAQAAVEPIACSAEQVAALEAANPCFRERHVERSRSGELLCQDTFFVGHFKGVGKVYLHTVVDTYGSLAFGFLHTSKAPCLSSRKPRSTPTTCPSHFDRTGMTYYFDTALPRTAPPGPGLPHGRSGLLRSGHLGDYTPHFINIIWGLKLA